MHIYQGCSHITHIFSTFKPILSKKILHSTPLQRGSGTKFSGVEYVRGSLTFFRKKTLKVPLDTSVYVIYSQMVIRSCRKTPRLFSVYPIKETELLVTRSPSQVKSSNVVIILVSGILKFGHH